MKITHFVSLALSGLLALTAVQAQTPPSGRALWMSSEVADAWKKGYKGSGTTITMVDDFHYDPFDGKLSRLPQVLTHGQWTLKQASMVAPGATMRARDFNFEQNRRVSLERGHLNVLNLSYGSYLPDGYTASEIEWDRLNQSIIDHAQSGKAVISKAAGNDAVALDTAAASGAVDYMNRALKGSASVLFVGALNTNGTPTARATLADYSNTPGTDGLIQNQFLVVGVVGSETQMYGTSFAAPIISGYAAILGSKFTKSTPTQITNRLLKTARQDTIAGYNPALHGRGEASLTRALAPAAIR